MGSFNVQGAGVARGRGRRLEGNSTFLLEILACKEVRSGSKPPMFIAEFSVVESHAQPGCDGKEVVPYRPGELVSWVCTVPPFQGGEKTQAEQINAFCFASVGGDRDAYLERAGELVDAATGVDNVLEGRVVRCSTVLAWQKNDKTKTFTHYNFEPYAYPEGETPATLAELLSRKSRPATAPKGAALPLPTKPATARFVVHSADEIFAPLPPPPPAEPPPPPPPRAGNPWDLLPMSYQRPASAQFPRGSYWDGKAWLSK
jgi:hypothetical protein